VGHPDLGGPLSASRPEPVAAPSLAQLIRADDAEAIAGFFDAHEHQVRCYCEHACAPELLDEVRDAAFVDFLGRVRTVADEMIDLDELLLRATRAVASGRFEVRVVPRGDAPATARQPAPEPACMAMPELLAAYENSELPGDGSLTSGHIERCATCTATLERIHDAEQAFRDAAPIGHAGER
jgi:hypothetical protein